MKWFPSKSFTVELRDDRTYTLDQLRRNTKLTENLVSDYTGKEFIGQVSDYGFKIISSEIGRGAVCVFIGELQDALGTLNIRIHNAFKILFSILMLLPIVGFVTAIVINGFVNSILIILPAVFGVLFVRFVFMELSFRFIARTGLNKLNSWTEN